MRTFGDFAAQGRENNLNLVRMIAAFAVLVSHAFAVVDPNPLEPLNDILPYSLGGLGLIVFFAISGFLVTQSVLRRRSLVDFAVARAARLVPGLFVMYLVVAFGIGPWFTTLGPRDYFSHAGLYLDLVRLPLMIDVSMPLPGVFARNPLPFVNVSLWSLPYEVACYGATAMAGLLGLLRPGRFGAILMLAVVALGICIARGSPVAEKQTLQLLIPFGLGMAFAVFRGHVPLSGLVLAGLAALTWLVRDTALLREGLLVSLSYGAFWVGGLRAPALLAYNRLGDASFGVYIYAGPVAQMTKALVPASTPGFLIAVAGAGVLIPAFLSWHWVEHPALRHRHRIGALLERWLRHPRKEKGPDAVAPDPRSVLRDGESA